MIYDSHDVTIQCVPQHVYSKLEKLAGIRTNGDMNELLLQFLKNYCWNEIDRELSGDLRIDCGFENFRRKYPQNAFFSATDYDFYLVVDLDTKHIVFDGFLQNEDLPQHGNILYFKIDGDNTGEDVFHCTRRKYIQSILQNVLTGLFYCLSQQRTGLLALDVDYKEYEIAYSCLLQKILNNFCEPQLLSYEDDIDAFLSRFSLDEDHVVFDGAEFFCYVSMLDRRCPPVGDIRLKLDLLALENGVYLYAIRWKNPVNRLIERICSQIPRKLGNDV